jgi:hypothetical protein
VRACRRWPQRSAPKLPARQPRPNLPRRTAQPSNLGVAAGLDPPRLLRSRSVGRILSNVAQHLDQGCAAARGRAAHALLRNLHRKRLRLRLCRATGRLAHIAADREGCAGRGIRVTVTAADARCVLLGRGRGRPRLREKAQDPQHQQRRAEGRARRKQSQTKPGLEPQRRQQLRQHVGQSARPHRLLQYAAGHQEHGRPCRKRGKRRHDLVETAIAGPPHRHFYQAHQAALSVRRS